MQTSDSRPLSTTVYNITCMRYKDVTQPSRSSCDHQQSSFETKSGSNDRLLAIRLEDLDLAPLSKVEQW